MTCYSKLQYQVWSWLGQRQSDRETVQPSVARHGVLFRAWWDLDVSIIWPGIFLNPGGCRGLGPETGRSHWQPLAILAIAVHCRPRHFFFLIQLLKYFLQVFLGGILLYWGKIACLFWIKVSYSHALRGQHWGQRIILLQTRRCWQFTWCDRWSAELRHTEPLLSSPTTSKNGLISVETPRSWEHCELCL